MKLLIIIGCLLLGCIDLVGQKKWYDTYFFDANAVLIYGTENTSGYNIAIAKKVKPDISIGLGLASYGYKNETNVKVAELVFEKSISENNKSIFLQVKPGLNFLTNPEELLPTWSSFEFEKSTVGTNLYAGIGVRFNVKRHAFVISVGAQQAKYNVVAYEYPEPVNPYVPFVEDKLKHTYKYKHQKMLISLGFRF